MQPLKRRAFLSNMGMGFGGLALGAMLNRDGIARAESEGAWRPPDGKPHFTPKAKRVIWLFMIGGVSHMDTFDPKPALNKFGGLTYDETPFRTALDSPLVKKNLREVITGLHKQHSRLYPMQVGYKKHGQSGIEVSDWFPHVGSLVDDIALVRSVWTTDNNHGAQMQFHTGRHVLEGQFPTIGSWAHYGLGSLNDNLPQFVVLGEPIDTCCGGLGAHGGAYLGPEHSGVQLSVDPANPLPFATPAGGVTRERQAREFALLSELNGLAAAEYPDEPSMRARIRSYELAFRMQQAVPDVMRLDEEDAATQRLYGLDHDVTKPFGQICLAATRMAERGVRFVQVFHGQNGGAGKWDGHSKLKKTHSELCAQVDKPVAGLLTDLKRRGLFDDTIVAFVTEFGRTPGAQGLDGRDHHPYGFTVWLAGGGIKGGVAHGATDEIGFHAVENRHYVTDIHATILHQLGLDPRKLEVPGRKRLDVDFGTPIQSIIA
ncbi:MAG: DUF1501 domain-containing protein [Bryobacterales bacterium]|nr:DUF1501 domain-containing protein [Bryobacterales bacterium]